MTQQTPSFHQTFDLEPRVVATELERGLTAAHAHCSPKYFYNAFGSTLFEAITHLPEYYPTRTEASIFAEHGTEIHQCIPQQAAWLDLGAGSCQKAASLFSSFFCCCCFELTTVNSLLHIGSAPLLHQNNTEIVY